MGLDNGIMVAGVSSEEIPTALEVSQLSSGIEVCYWRKWWGFRNEVVNYLRNKYFSFYEQYDWELEIEDLAKIYEIYINCTKEEWWVHYSDSVWTYEEIAPQIDRELMRLRWLMTCKMNYPDAHIVFYDSY